MPLLNNSYPFRDLDVQHEEVHMFLSFVHRQHLGNDCHQHGSAGYTLKSNTHKHTVVGMVTDIFTICLYSQVSQ